MRPRAAYGTLWTRLWKMYIISRCFHDTPLSYIVWLYRTNGPLNGRIIKATLEAFPHTTRQSARDLLYLPDCVPYTTYLA